MRKHLHILHKYIKEGLVSISSISIDGRDDVAGFRGIHLHDGYSDWLFQNQCLYYSKGIADFVSVIRANQFFLPLSSSSSSFKILSMNDILNQLNVDLIGKLSSSSSSSSNLPFNKNKKTNRLTGGISRNNRIQTRNFSYCFVKFHILQISEPKDSFLVRGPGEESWSSGIYIYSFIMYNINLYYIIFILFRLLLFTTNKFI
jgi:hypothetical protein